MEIGNLVPLRMKAQKSFRGSKGSKETDQTTMSGERTRNERRGEFLRKLQPENLANSRFRI
uniref:Uncharacterized protein n=1 Tax=Glossina morsitans morsitans TaxID=37546 RepID=A0A1B0G024_GLOMM